MATPSTDAPRGIAGVRRVAHDHARGDVFGRDAVEHDLGAAVIDVVVEWRRLRRADARGARAGRAFPWRAACGCRTPRRAWPSRRGARRRTADPAAPACRWARRSDRSWPSWRTSAARGRRPARRAASTAVLLEHDLEPRELRARRARRATSSGEAADELLAAADRRGRPRPSRPAYRNAAPAATSSRRRRPKETHAR
jgi:hypothetical protein